MTKVIVHTKTGKKLTYYSKLENVEALWMNYVSTPEGSVGFGRYTIPRTNIDFVEFQ